MGYSIACYLASQHILKHLCENFLIHGYLNDFVAMPVLLSYSNILIVVGTRNDLLLPGLKRVAPFTILVGLFWEYVTPLYQSSKCCDPYDLIAYGLGSLLYLGIIRAFADGKDPRHAFQGSARTGMGDD
jgi:hypothetical protein